MKPWRERIVEARARGRFTEADYRAWADCDTCLVGEQRAKHGIRFFLTQFDWMEGHKDTQVAIAGAIGANDFDAVEHLLDAIEDRALQLKRAGGTDHN